MRKGFGVLAGIVAALLLVSLTDLAGSLLYLNGSVDSADPAALAAYVSAMPVPAKIVIVTGWVIAPFGGTWLSLRIGDWAIGGWSVTAACVIAGVINQIALSRPLWMQICALVLPLVGGWIAQRVHHKPYAGEPLLG